LQTARYTQAPEGKNISYYAQISDLQGRYGQANAAMMADPDQSGDPTEIANRQQLALNVADDWVNGFLRLSKYSHLVDTTGIVDSTTNEPPELLTTAAVMYAGWWLSTSHGVRDYDKDNRPMNRYYADFQTAEQIMLRIQKIDTFKLNVEA